MVKVASKREYDSGFTKDRLKDAQSKMRGSSKGKIYDKVEAPYPTVNEPALVHPWNQSIVKLRDNGNVDVFANTDNGIRINPNAKTIDVFTQTYNHHVSFIRSFVKRDEIHHVGGSWIINCGSATINAKTNADINAANANVNARGKATVKGSAVDVIAGGKATVKGSNVDVSGSSVNVKAGGNLNLTAGGSINFNASGKYNFN